MHAQVGAIVGVPYSKKLRACSAPLHQDSNSSLLRGGRSLANVLSVRTLHAYVSDIPARRPAAAHQPMLLLYLLTWTSTPPVTLTGMTEPQSPESIKLRCSDPLAALLQQCSSDRDLQRVIRRAIRATLPHSTTIPQCRKLSNR